MIAKQSIEDTETEIEIEERSTRQIPLSRSLWRFLKIQAASNGTTIPQEIERAVEIYQANLQTSKDGAY